ncbi:phosphonate metabolism protein PhnK [Pseudoflavonifractor sp. An176]|uniref:ABC transporter ATP-binding protein n=1 Tax=Pseudoflavonifractor sp. An176 TaxID=1965572 RepID=UPI000B36F204|nr:ABC transporter ATP-binding protein [Pseudoflavonifractor sp. An176]OUP64376.1 phosphonate metabolism protein PhnK [Pseudoflavonifractor sp. An176]
MLLQVQELSVSYPQFHLHPLSFQLDRGEILSVIGESGSGKTSLVQAISCLLPPEGKVGGQVLLHGADFLTMREAQRRKLRMKTLSVAFQNSVEWLNPKLTLAQHLREVLAQAYSPEECIQKAHALMELVGLSPDDLSLRPHQLSGGMVQKFLLANAVALDPELVLLDEPTASLDPESCVAVHSAIEKLRDTLGTAFLVVTHDMGLARSLGGRTMVLYQGHIEETGPTRDILNRPRHPYTRGLLQSAVTLNPLRDLWGIRPNTALEQPGHHCCPFYGRCTQSIPLCGERAPNLEPQPDGRALACHRGGIVPLLSCHDLSHAYGATPVLNHVDLTLYAGEIVSLVGRSGAGKTTLARLLSGLLPCPAHSSIRFQGQEQDLLPLHRRLGGIQMVLQDSQAALNPHLTVEEAVSEPMRLAKVYDPQRLSRALEDVSLYTCDSFYRRKVGALSGGQKQRLALARALTMEPAVLLADEPTSMLDPSAKANLLRMLKGLQYRRGFSMLMITHDLYSACKISDHIYLLDGGTLYPVNPEQVLHTDFTSIFTHKEEHTYE